MGNYGEVLKVSSETAVDAAMRGGKEVVLFYPKTLGTKPAIEALTPADFARDGLLELLVTPRSGPQDSSLAELCELRRRSLKEEKAVFTESHCRARKGCAIIGIDWPVDTCQFDVTAPEKISQIFTARGDAWFQLTSGVDFGAPAAYEIVRSVMEAVNPPVETAAQTSRHYDTARGAWAQLAPERPWPQLWLFVNGLLLLVAVLPLGPWRPRRARVGACAIALCNGFVALGLLYSALGLALKVGPVNNLLILGLSLALFAPLGIFLWARRGAANPRAVGIAAVVAALPLAALALLALRDRPEPPAVGGPFVSYIVLSLAGLLQGLVVGATARPRQAGL